MGLKQSQRLAIEIGLLLRLRRAKSLANSAFTSDAGLSRPILKILVFFSLKKTKKLKKLGF